MPTRTIPDSLLTDTRLAQLDPSAEILYRRMWQAADDYGNIPTALVHNLCYPLDPRDQSATRADIDALAHAGLLHLYNVEGKEYANIIGHGQQIKSRPKYPPPPIEHSAIMTSTEEPPRTVQNYALVMAACGVPPDRIREAAGRYAFAFGTGGVRTGWREHCRTWATAYARTCNTTHQA